MPRSERVGETYRAIFLELPISVMAVAGHAIVEAGIDEEIGGNITIETKGECVFPLQF